VTGAEWRACTDPQAMLEFLHGKVSNRKLRLFAVACCRQDRDLLADLHNRLAVDTSERYADGLVSRRELKSIRRAVWEALSDADSKAAWEAAGVRAWEAAAATLWRPGPFRDGSGPISVLRDIFGPQPFRPVAIAPAWLSWNSGTVPAIARRIYDERAYHDLPILADALEDAGCTDADILAHCRGPGPHVRGCWVVDLLLGKA
jgi:hypothetical protein